MAEGLSSSPFWGIYSFHGTPPRVVERAALGGYNAGTKMAILTEDGGGGLDPEGDARAERHAADLKLARAYVVGSSSAAELLATRLVCVPKLLRKAHSHLGRPLGAADLDELSQDVIVKILEKLETFEGRATLETWAYRICHLELMNRMRRQHRRGERSQSDSEDLPDPSYEPEPMLGEDYAAIHKALEDLGPPAEDIIRMKHFHDQTFQAIAEALGVSVNTAKTRYYRGMRWLEERLGREGDLS